MLEPGRVVEVPISAHLRTVKLCNATAAPFRIEAVDRGTALTISVSEPAATLPVRSTEYVDECRRFLSEYLPVLHCGPREEDVNGLATARAGDDGAPAVSIEQLRSYAGRRIRGGLAITGYGIFARLARDCLQSASAWGTAGQSSPTRSTREWTETLSEWTAALGRAGPGFRPVLDAITEVLGARTGEPSPDILEELDARMLEIARAATGDDPAPREAAAQRLEPFRGRMTAAQLGDLETRVFDQLLRGRYGLPRLVLESSG